LLYIPNWASSEIQHHEQSAFEGRSGRRSFVIVDSQTVKPNGITTH
jgi:hypothetical protein